MHCTCVGLGYDTCSHTSWWWISCVTLNHAYILCNNNSTIIIVYCLHMALWSLLTRDSCLDNQPSPQRIQLNGIDTNITLMVTMWTKVSMEIWRQQHWTAHVTEKASTNVIDCNWLTMNTHVHMNIVNMFYFHIDKNDTTQKQGCHVALIWYTMVTHL